MRWLVLSLPLFCLIMLVPDVVITTGDGSGNTTAPPDDPGFANVGDKGDSAVYLGNGWVLTARHSGADDVELLGVTRAEVPGSAVEIAHDASYDADLLLFRIENPPALPPLPIATLPPQVGEEVILVGNGKDRAGSPTLWDSLWNEVAPGSSYAWQGWKKGGGRTIRWGINVVSEVDREVVAAGARTREFIVDFDDAPDEAQGATGDSGGAVFVKRGGQWKLAGILNLVQLLPGQPDGTFVPGDRTYAVDLSFYREEILAVAPPLPADVPSSSAPAGLALVGLLAAIGAAASRRG